MSMRYAKRSTTGTAGAASAVVAAENLGRYNITVVNDHATQIIYLQLSTTADGDPVAVVGQGVRLNAAGGSWASSFRGAVAAIGSGAGTNYTVIEY